MVLKVDDDEKYGETKPILEGNGDGNAEQPSLKIHEIYRNLTSAMKTDPLTIDNPAVALDLFSTALHVRNSPLAKQCVDILNKQMNKKNVLMILRHLSNCRTQPSYPYNMEPSAPPLNGNTEQDDGWKQTLVNNLRNNCLLEIDKHADYVLKHKDFMELVYQDVLAVTTRDTLQVSNEMIVYSAVMRWCIEECKRRTLETQKVNVKAVLRDLVYAPRYGLMSKRDFLCWTIDGVKGPDRSGILDESETERILEYIRKRSSRNQGRLVELPFKGSTPRRPPQDKPWNSTKDGACDKFIINFLTCWTAIFD